MSVQLVHAFLWYSQQGAKDDEANEHVDEWIVWLGHQDAFVGTVLKVLTEKDTQVENGRSCTLTRIRD